MGYFPRDFMGDPHLRELYPRGKGGRLNEQSFRSFWSIAWWLFVKGWHAFEFGLLHFLTRLALRGRSWIPLMIAGLYAISDEGRQLFVPNRGCRASDVCIDRLGILATWTLFQTSGRGRRTPRVAALAIGLWLAAIYVLSIFPFGLVTLNRGAGGTTAALAP